MEEYEFDFDEILKEFRNGKRLTGKGGMLAPLVIPPKNPIFSKVENSSKIL